MPAAPRFFATLPGWRAWLEQNHASEQELWVGFYKRDSGRPSISWPESVDGALCFGWIDGVRKSIDAFSYKIRFTPRKPRSIWSAINMKRATELKSMGLMHAAGLAAFERRDEKRSAIYAYEQRKTAKLPPEHEKQFRANKTAWRFFTSQPPWYQRTSTYWVISAKKEETKLKRLAKLIKDSGNQKSIAQLTRPQGKK
jgi:uncharacterized protein YdeI (YjbR/CyaY-like superfamily)